MAFEVGHVAKQEIKKKVEHKQLEFKAFKKNKKQP